MFLAGSSAVVCTSLPLRVARGSLLLLLFFARFRRMMEARGEEMIVVEGMYVCACCVAVYIGIGQPSRLHMCGGKGSLRARACSHV